MRSKREPRPSTTLRLWKNLPKQVPQHNIRLPLFVCHILPGEVFLVQYGVLAECVLALEYFHALLAASPSAPLNQVDDIDMGVSNNLDKMATC